MTTKITADNIAANTITLAQLAPGAITELGAGGGGGGGTANLTATAYFEGTLSLSSAVLPRWYPYRPVTIYKSIARVISAGSDPVTLNINKTENTQYSVSVVGTTATETSNTINMSSDDYLTVQITGTGVGAQNLYVTFLYSETV